MITEEKYITRNGLTRGRYRIYGKTLTKSFSFDPKDRLAKQEARRKAEAFLVDMERGEMVMRERRLDQVYREWIDLHLSTRDLSAPRIAEMNRQRGIFCEAMGDTPVSQIDGPMLHRFLTDLDAGYATKRDMLSTIKRVLKFAHSMKWTRDDSWQHLQIAGRQKKRPQKWLTKADVQKLSDEKLLYLLLASTGLRIGEALALSWDDVDFDEALLRVERSVGRHGFSEGKTQHARRVVPISARLVLALKEAKLASASPHVFSGDGGLLLDYHVARYALQSDLKRLGIVDVGFHAFRRYYRSALAEMGIAKAVIDARLGHTPGGNVGEAHYTKASREALMERESVESVL